LFADRINYMPLALEVVLLGIGFRPPPINKQKNDQAN